MSRHSHRYKRKRERAAIRAAIRDARAARRNGGNSMDRPTPLKEVASKVGTVWALVSGVVSALVTFGVLTAVQAGAITAAGDALPSTITAIGTIIAGLAPLISGVVAAFRTASVGADYVTPVSSPMSSFGEKLIPEGAPPCHSD